MDHAPWYLGHRGAVLGPASTEGSAVGARAGVVPPLPSPPAPRGSLPEAVHLESSCSTAGLRTQQCFQKLILTQGWVSSE